MCPACLATGGLYLAGGLAAGAVTTFLATRLSRNRAESTASTASTEAAGGAQAAHDDRKEQ